MARGACRAHRTPTASGAAEHQTGDQEQQRGQVPQHDSGLKSGGGYRGWGGACLQRNRSDLCRDERHQRHALCNVQHGAVVRVERQLSDKRAHEHRDDALALQQGIAYQHTHHGQPSLAQQHHRLPQPQVLATRAPHAALSSLGSQRNGLLGCIRHQCALSLCLHNHQGVQVKTQVQQPKAAAHALGGHFMPVQP